jgi:AhpD family alkylhydroperoxidase
VAKFKSVQPNPNTKVKELIGLAVAAQISCTYCIYFHTTAAKLNGATDAEIREAVAMATISRHWSISAQRHAGRSCSLVRRKSVDVRAARKAAQLLANGGCHWHTFFSLSLFVGKPPSIGTQNIRSCVVHALSLQLTQRDVSSM